MLPCPFCDRADKFKVIKEWSYSGRKVVRYQCKCDQKFNHFTSPTGKEWTVPKSKK